MNNLNASRCLDIVTLALASIPNGHGRLVTPVAADRPTVITANGEAGDNHWLVRVTLQPESSILLNTVEFEINGSTGKPVISSCLYEASQSFIFEGLLWSILGSIATTIRREIQVSMTIVTNLMDGTKQEYTCSPYTAVMSAHAQSLGDFETWNYEKNYSGLAICGKIYVCCGNFVAAMRSCPDGHHYGLSGELCKNA